MKIVSHHNVNQEEVIEETYDADAVHSVYESSMPWQGDAKVFDIDSTFESRTQEAHKGRHNRAKSSIYHRIEDSWNKFKGLEAKQGNWIRQRYFFFLEDRIEIFTLKIFKETIVKSAWSAEPKVALHDKSCHNVGCYDIADDSTNETFDCFVWT